MWYAGTLNQSPATPDGDKARETAQPVSDPVQSSPQAEVHAEELATGIVHNDRDPNLRGLASRDVGGEVTARRQFAPWWASLATQDHTERIDSQVATSGTAAARERSGQSGAGTMEYTQGITPEIHEGMAVGGQLYGGGYFEADKASVLQEGMSDAITSPISDPWWNAIGQANAERQSRRAYQSSVYGQFLSPYTATDTTEN